jgi:hypothetical protein
MRIDTVAAGQFERYAFDGENSRTVSSLKPIVLLDGERAELWRLDSPFVRYGDWKRWYPEALVIQIISDGGKEVVLVRSGDTSAPARTLYIDLEKGGIFAEDSMTYVEMLGRIGQHQEFGDYRDISGMFLPFRTEVTLAHRLIGTISTTVTDVELGVELPEGVFELEGGL